jgi:hypothetical protein
MVNNGRVEPDANPPAAPAATAAPQADLGKRNGRSPRDMAMSLLILIIPIGLLLTFYRLVLNGDAPITVDPEPTLRQARAAAVFPIVLPAGLGDDWHITSASWRNESEGATLRLGYVAPDDDAALLVESSVPPEQLLPIELSKNAEPRGIYRDGERAWRAYDSRPGEIGLVLTEPGRTIVLVGNTDEKNLQALAASLR